MAWLAVVLFIARPARAYTAPPIQGHITDLAGKLSASERDDLEVRLEAVNHSSGAEIAVLMVTSLQGDTIEDVAYGTFNARKIGKKDKDNRVLLVIALAERRVRIETGKGGGRTAHRASNTGYHPAPNWPGAQTGPFLRRN